MQCSPSTFHVHGCWPRRFPRLLLVLPLAALLALAAGCGRNKKIIEIDDRFSFNVVRTPSWFPDPKKPLPTAEQDVYDRYGKPDFMRFWWRPDGSIIRSSDLAAEDQESLGEKLATIPKSWLYMREDKEIVFLRNGESYKEQPIAETTKLICNYGDPSNRTRPVVRHGVTYETWQWIEHGIQIELADGVELKRSHFQGTGAGTYLLK